MSAPPWTWTRPTRASWGHTSGTVSAWPSGRCAAWIPDAQPGAASREALLYRDHDGGRAVGRVSLAPTMSDEDAQAAVGAVLDGWRTHYREQAPRFDAPRET